MPYLVGTVRRHCREHGRQRAAVVGRRCARGENRREYGRQHGRHAVQIVHAAGVVQAQRGRERRLRAVEKRTDLMGSGGGPFGGSKVLFSTRMDFM